MANILDGIPFVMGWSMMTKHRSFSLHGDNVVECERFLDLVKEALGGGSVSLSGPFGSPTNPSFRLHVAGRWRGADFHFLSRV